MKMSRVLISFILVNISAASLMKAYMKEVYLTNIHVQKAYEYNNTFGNGLENIIKTLVYQNRSMDELNLMVAVPEFFNPEQILTLDLQGQLRYEIQFRLGIPEPDPNDYDLNMFNYSFSGYSNRHKHGEARRLYTGEALKNIISSGLKYRAGELLIGFKFIHVCRLTALYKNTKHLPFYSLDYYVKAANTDNSDLCTLTSTRRNSSTYYKQFGNQIFQVWKNGAKMEPLLNDYPSSSSSSSS